MESFISLVFSDTHIHMLYALMDLTRSLYISLSHTHTHVNIYMRDGFEISQLNHEEKAFKTVKKKRKQKEKKNHKDNNFQRIEEVS